MIKPMILPLQLVLLPLALLSVRRRTGTGTRRMKRRKTR
jgi:hypothetical protein